MTRATMSARSRSTTSSRRMKRTATTPARDGSPAPEVRSYGSGLLYPNVLIDSPPDPFSNAGSRGVGMNNRPASLVVAIVLWLIALAQLLRVLLRVEVRAGDVSIPLWVSIVAFVVLAALGIWLWRERRE